MVEPVTPRVEVLAWLTGTDGEGAGGGPVGAMADPASTAAETRAPPWSPSSRPESAAAGAAPS